MKILETFAILFEGESAWFIEHQSYDWSSMVYSHST